MSIRPVVPSMPLPPALPDGPFTRREALERGLDDYGLGELTLTGLLRRPLRGVYHSAGLRDTLELRVACLRLVVPDDAVVTDRTAAWLHGAAYGLAPNDDLVVPEVSIFRSPGHRLRNKLVDSGERMLSAADVVDVGGLRVTSPLRTACDLGRLLHRDQAIAALDSLSSASGLAPRDLLEALPRFRGFRGVRQLRELAPLVDGRSQSPGESVLRLRWLDCHELPRPEPQLEVEGPRGRYFLDLGLRSPKYAAEYDGAAWHGADVASYDSRRRDWLRDELGYVIDVFRSTDIHGRGQCAERTLREGYARACRRA